MREKKENIREIVLPRIDGKLTKLAEQEDLRKEEDYVNHLLRRRKNLMKKLDEYE